ncbi:hydroxymethylpyrimidine/phosphomethylpyrimidine kinase [Flaviflexus sp. JY899]|uniref:pyridoxal kinase n=2 Tax=Flaviflexus equikiangi TaxID=2758573 RepID=A0ABS2TC21_9ACTO|nr:hydroxymethylpyrimidine/phosphomethylpyrimidine kinase [Flaviflexus equikiangi]MBM9432200.1 hydroxymethylpyrimidine/phosphomethylpyrimidine kinase [Flaviflexus equikiangi]
MNFAYTIAGSEAAGVAGLQVDLKTFHELGVYGLGTLTCIVTMHPDDDWSHSFTPIAPGLISDQFDAATAAFDLDTVKIGMLGTVPTIETVAEKLRSRPWKNIVVDPVLICKGQEPGQAFDTDAALRREVLSQATVTTPNHFEALTLSGMESFTTVDDLIEAGQRIAEHGPKAVVVKGGIDFPGDDAVDVLWDGHEATVYRAPKVGDHRVNGAGCTLAAAITAELAKGTDLKEAVQIAKDVVTAGIEHRISGHAPFDTVWQGAYQH